MSSGGGRRLLVRGDKEEWRKKGCGRGMEE